MRIIRLIILALVVLLPSGTALAAPIASPTAYSIGSVTAYSPALETGDQLYIITGSITYGTNPDEDAGQAWLIRLKENGAEVASTTIYAYYNDGYAAYVASIYLPASLAVTWSGNVTITLEPNPTLTWTSIPAAVIYSAISWNTATTLDEVSTAVGIKVRSLALNLNTSWTSLDLIESVSGLLKFTSYGEGYFDVVIPILRTVVPDLYQSILNTPVIVNPNYGDTYQQQVDNTTSGTPLDTASLATDVGISRMWTNGALWGLFCILVSGTVGFKAQTVKPVFFLFGGLMIAGGFMGFGLLQSVLFVLLGIASIILAFAWKGA